MEVFLFHCVPFVLLAPLCVHISTYFLPHPNLLTSLTTTYMYSPPSPPPTCTHLPHHHLLVLTSLTTTYPHPSPPPTHQPHPHLLTSLTTTYSPPSCNLPLLWVTQVPASHALSCCYVCHSLEHWGSHCSSSPSSQTAPISSPTVSYFVAVEGVV